MMRSNTFHNLVDDGRPFAVVRKCVSGEQIRYDISPPLRNEVAVSWSGQEIFRGDANAVLSYLNYVLAIYEHDLQGGLPGGGWASRDIGTVLRYSIVAPAWKAHKRANFDIECILLWADGMLASEASGLFELDLNGQISLHYCAMEDRAFTEVCRISMNAIPKSIHGKLAAAGMGWKGDGPTPRESFLLLYGEEELDRFDHDLEGEREEFHHAARSALEKKR